jgi:terminase large subunit-like protein
VLTPADDDQAVVDESIIAAAGGRYVVMCSWSEVPHLTKAAQLELYKSIPPHQRAARSKGVPQLGSGVIYPVPEDELRVPDFKTPSHYRRGYALDTGWNWTVAVFGALDPDTDVLYITHVYKRAEAPPSLHAEAIKARGGSWMKGVGDSAQINQEDGEQVIAKYRGLGLDITLPDKAVEAGIQELWERMVSGRFKVMASCSGWFEEFRLYRRNEKGLVVKQNDHYMDATRYLGRSGIKRMQTAPVEKPTKNVFMSPSSQNNGWMR